MGFYFRKSLSFGPIRFNLSRSGLGASFGVPGARIGVGPRGAYLQAGRGGFYYRQTLISPRHNPRQDVQLLPQLPIAEDLKEINSVAADTIVNSSADQLLQELIRIKKRTDVLPFLLVAGAILLVRVASIGVLWPLLPLIAATAAMALVARHYDVTNGTVVLTYSLEENAGKEFAALQSAFRQFSACCGLWRVDAAGETSDWKRNAGASSLERRSSAQVSSSAPPKVVCNMEIPALGTGRKRLFFFPDRLLFYDATGVGAVSYSDIDTQAAQQRFIENDSVPGDAPHVGTTWRFVNKAGGPDRRFNNNRQLPILLYGLLSIRSPSGLNELF